MKGLMIRVLRLVGFVEGLSYVALLFVAMPLKYMADMPVAVQWTGWAHGGLYIAYMAVLIGAWALGAIGAQRFSWGFLAGLLPFGTFVNDRSLRKRQQELAAG